MKQFFTFVMSAPTNMNYLVSISIFFRRPFINYDHILNDYLINDPDEPRRLPNQYKTLKCNDRLVYYYQQEVKAENIDAMVLLGDYYHERHILKTTHQPNCPIYKKIYNECISQITNILLMKYYYMMASQCNNTDAMAKLAKYYLTSPFGRYDAYKYCYMMTNRAKTPEEYHILGDLFMAMDNTNDTHQEAYYYYYGAGKLGCGEAFYKAGKIKELLKDTDDSITLYQKAIENKYYPVAIPLAIYYQSKKQYDKKTECLKLAADDGNKEAMAMLKTHYEYVEPNAKLAKLYTIEQK